MIAELFGKLFSRLRGNDLKDGNEEKVNALKKIKVRWENKVLRVKDLRANDIIKITSTKSSGEKDFSVMMFLMIEWHSIRGLSTDGFKVYVNPKYIDGIELLARNSLKEFQEIVIKVRETGTPAYELYKILVSSKKS